MSRGASAYLKTFQTLEKLMEAEYLQVDLRELHVRIDYRIHALYMYDDKKYLAFIDKVVAWMNFKRGLLGVKQFIEPTHRINFTVFRMDDVYTVGDKEVNLTDIFQGNSVSDFKIQHKPTDILVGYAENGRLDYAPIKTDY